MLLLIFGRILLARRGLLSKGVKLGVEFWATIYIPIVVAMAAQQNVVAALKGGPVVVIAAVLTVGICFGILDSDRTLSKYGRLAALCQKALTGAMIVGGMAKPSNSDVAPDYSKVPLARSCEEA